MSDFESIRDIIQNKNPKQKTQNPYISREFQNYGCQLAEELGDFKHKSLYIKIAKEIPRPVIEEAKSYVADYPNAKRKGALFMWRLKELNGSLPFGKGKKDKTKKEKKIKEGENLTLL